MKKTKSLLKGIGSADILGLQLFLLGFDLQLGVMTQILLEIQELLVLRKTKYNPLWKIMMRFVIKSHVAKVK